jgi:uncharacterized membrane protein
MNLFSLARAGVNLTPGQRAILRLVEGVIVAAAVAALPVVAQFLAGADLAHLDYAALARYSVGAFLVALIMAVMKYAKAHGDPALVATLDPVAANAEGAIRQWADIPNDVVIEPELPAMPASVAEAVSTAPAAPEASS